VQFNLIRGKEKVTFGLAKKNTNGWDLETIKYPSINLIQKANDSFITRGAEVFEYGYRGAKAIFFDKKISALFEFDLGYISIPKA